MEELSEEDFAAQLVGGTSCKELIAPVDPKTITISEQNAAESEIFVERMSQDLFTIPPPFLSEETEDPFRDPPAHPSEETKAEVVASGSNGSLEKREQLSSFINAFDEDFCDEKLSNLKALGQQTGTPELESSE